MDKDLHIRLIEREVAILVRRGSFSRHTGRVLDRAAYLFLYQLNEHGPSGVKSLAEEFHLDVSTVSRQAATLEAKKYIERIQDPNDLRSSTFRLTDLGIQKLEEEQAIRVALYTKLLNDWTPDETQKLGELLHRLNRTFIE